MVRIKRVYCEPGSHDGTRILVDRVWPRGISKEQASLAGWWKDLASSHSLRKWFGHDPHKWEAFRKRYRKELSYAEPKKALEELARLSHQKTVTLIYSAADEGHNQAVVLKELLEELA
jgi:uncharacterized protein YeaO (DUF488 family)